MRMTRYWMTGCMALILLAAGRWPARDETEETQLRQGARITLTSKYGLDETIRQIERSARLNGLPVVARASPTPPVGSAAQAGQARVLVLGDEGGQTPMLQADDRPVASADLPWTVLIHQRADGRTEVSLSDPDAMALPDGVSSELLERVTAMPQLVRAAIT
jgi:uncharacterized protein (DUF302 family)